MVQTGKISIILLGGLLVLLQGCSGGGSSATVTTTTFNPAAISPVLCSINTDSTPPPNPSCSAGDVLVSGHISFERVPHNAGVDGDSSLNYALTSPQPVRGATVQAIYTGGQPSTVTDASGNYSICVPQNTDMVVRARAEMLRSGGEPSWNFTVVDNTAGKSVYALQSSSFNSGSTNITGKDLLAASGWNVVATSYTGTRAAAPFAILDTVYDAFHKVLGACSGARFPALKINWSVNNVPLAGDASVGRIGTSYFDGTEIYLLGAEDNDTDEYDEHVIAHEWGHYFEEYFSRTDSIGGQHTGGDRLDVRVAFSEGFGNAYSAMVTDDPDYNDAQGNLQAGGFDINIESNSCVNQGWYNECSAQSILYDLYDAANDDGVSLAFSPLFNVFSNEQRNTYAVTSIFSFIYELKQNNPGSVAAIDTLVSSQNIDVVNDIYGDSELTNNPGTVSKLPLHDRISAGQTVSACSTSEFQSYNGLGVSRFIRFDASAGQAFRIRAIRTSGFSPADPDIEVHFRGQTAVADSVDVNSEIFDITVGQTGTYVIEVYDYNNRAGAVGTTCFNVSMTSI